MGAAGRTTAGEKTTQRETFLRRVAPANTDPSKAVRSRGMDENDETFLPLRREDVKAFAMFTGEEQLGDSKKMPSWIWEKINFLSAQGDGKVREYCIEGTQV